MKKIYSILAIGLLVFGLGANAQDTKTTQEAPASYTFTFPDSKNQMINITASADGLEFKEQKGKIVLLNFFGKKCPPCLMEIPHLIKIQDEYKENFQIVALQVQQPMTQEALDNFIKEKNINYQVADTPKMQDFTGFIMSAAQWRGMIPFMILFDQNGVVYKMYQGMVSEDILKKDIEALIAKLPKK
jgi:thiol-disulfide isomerase/thioredoxin